MRRRIFDPTAPETSAGKQACPACGESLAWAEASDLRRVDIRFRCPPGRAPVASELRCRVCNTRIVVVGRPPNHALLHDQAGALASLDAAERELIEARIEKLGERDGNRGR